METVNKHMLMCAFLMSFCKQIETKGLCEFAEMFPSDGKEKCFTQRKCSIEMLKANSTDTTAANNRTTDVASTKTSYDETSGITKLQKTESFSTSAATVGFRSCPQNMEYGSCSCQASCDDPHNQHGCINTCTNQTCVCRKGFLIKGEDCVRKEDCGCFVQGEGVIKDGKPYVTSNCTKRCSCNANQLMCDDIQCSDNAQCRDIEGARRCECKEGFVGDGETCAVAATDCLDLYTTGVKLNGVYTIYPTGWSGLGFEVYCEMESNGGGWTVFQQRLNGSVDFYRNWTSYKHGFGILTHEFWLGNDKIHILTRQGNYQLRIDVVDSQDVSVFSLYSSFSVSDENDRYRLSVGTESGNTVGNPLKNNNGQHFSTYDQENDGSSINNCAEESHGAWWYNKLSHGFDDSSYYCWKWFDGNSLHFCSDSNLNGGYQENGLKSVFFWYRKKSPDRRQCGNTRTQMKIRRG